MGKAPQECADPLLQQQADWLERTAEEMRGYSLKHNATRRALMTEDENKSAQRGLILAAGHPGLIAPLE